MIGLQKPSQVCGIRVKEAWKLEGLEAGSLTTRIANLNRSTRCWCDKPIIAENRNPAKPEMYFDYCIIVQPPSDLSLPSIPVFKLSGFQAFLPPGFPASRPTPHRPIPAAAA
jgi:hypothetical protein